MLNSLRFNIYFFFLIFAAIGLLWFFNFISNRIILKQEVRQSEVFKMHDRFSNLVIDEKQVVEPGDYTALIKREKAFFQQCTQCHVQRTKLPDERIATLARRNELLRSIVTMRDETRKRLSELFASVHYIHEHHIVFLQNYLDYVRFGNRDTSRDKLWKIYADEAVKEPEIIRSSVNIQHQIANIIYDFSMLPEITLSDRVQNSFTSHIEAFYRSVNRFESLSIDAQDGLLVEELLENGRLLEKNFSKLIHFITENNRLAELLERNREALEQAFVSQEAMLRRKQLAMMQQATAINWGSIVLAIFLCMLFLLRARKLLHAIDELVEQTRQLGSDITYRIPEKKSVPAELAVLRTILNRLAYGLNRQIETLNEEIENRRRIEQEKESYAAYLDSILSSSSHTAIVAADTDLRIKYFNPEAERMFGVKKQEVMGKDIHAIHSRLVKGKSIRKKSFNRILDKVGAGTVHSFRFEMRELTIDARLSVIRNRDGELSGYLLMANDITEWLAAENQRKVMRQRLQKAEKMEAIGLMAGGVAHDLNNILSGIINYPELMLMQSDKDDKWRKPLEAIKASGLRAAAIVADLLTIARGVTSEKQVCSINELVAAYLDTPEYRRLASRHPEVVLETELEEKLRPCRCSPVHIQKMLMNLVSNAFESIEDKGKVIIATANMSLDEQEASEYGIKAGDYVRITVRDTGKGITDEDAMHVFEPFYTKKKMGHSGTGLGLAVVWNTVQDHRGTVTIQDMSPGTAFVVLLPACKDKGLRALTHEPDERPAGKGHILVVDDEPMQRDVARQMLEALGYDVATAANGRDAIKYVREHDVDMVIMDMVMEPDMNGRQALEEIRKLKPGQRALIVSGFADSDEVQKVCSMGKTPLINKPYTFNKLASAVREALDS